MNKSKLKDLLVVILIVIIWTGLVLFGSFIVAKGITKAKADYLIEMSHGMVDMRKATSFSTTETGLYINFLDGGYYLEIPNKTETNYTYVICDVVYYYGDSTEDIYATNLVCEMPNGELHTYTIEDAPEEAELVCFRTDNQDDYTTYEVVAVR
jgi:hypothetical protein